VAISRLQPSSHPALNSLRALFFPTDHQQFVRQPPDVCASLRSHILHVRRHALERLGDGIDAINQNLLLSAPDKNAFDQLVNAREPICRSEYRLVVIVKGCWSCDLCQLGSSIDTNIVGDKYQGKRWTTDRQPLCR
jgi:hypothetical protein